MAHVLRLKVKLLIILVLVVVNTILLATVRPKQAPYDLISFVKASIFWPSSYSTDAHNVDWDKVVVTPARDIDDVSWIAQDLPRYVLNGLASAMLTSSKLATCHILRRSSE